MSLDIETPGTDPRAADADAAAICSIEPHPDTPGLVLRGELDLSTVDEVSAALVEVSRPGTATVVDMSAVSFLDSSGLRALVQHRMKCDELTIQDPSPQVTRLLELTSTAEVFTIVRTDDQG